MTDSSNQTPLPSFAPGQVLKAQDLQSLAMAVAGMLRRYKGFGSGQPLDRVGVLQSSLGPASDTHSGSCPTAKVDRIRKLADGSTEKTGDEDDVVNRWEHLETLEAGTRVHYGWIDGEWELKGADCDILSSEEPEE